MKKGGSRKLKVLTKPESLPEGMLPDPQQFFLRREQREFEELHRDYLSPTQLKLEPDEVENQVVYNFIIYNHPLAG